MDHDYRRCSPAGLAGKQQTELINKDTDLTFLEPVVIHVGLFEYYIIASVTTYSQGLIQ